MSELAARNTNGEGVDPATVVHDLDYGIDRDREFMSASPRVVFAFAPAEQPDASAAVVRPECVPVLPAEADRYQFAPSRGLSAGVAARVSVQGEMGAFNG